MNLKDKISTQENMTIFSPVRVGARKRRAKSRRQLQK